MALAFAANPVSQILNARLLVIGSAVVTPAALVSGAVMTGAFFVGAWIAAKLMTRMRARAHSGRTVLYLVQKLVTYALVALGLFTGLSTVGLNLSSLAVFAGAIGVGVGLGLQGIVKEFVSGLVLILDNELHVGDFIELEAGLRGEVREIGARATHIRTNDNVDVLVPNSKLIDGTIINWTQGGLTRRIHVPFSVAYGVDKAKVRDAVLAAARSVPFTLPETDATRTQVWMTGFGDSALNFELVVWPKLDAVKRPASMTAAYTWAIEDALRQADIEMPFPQLDVRLRSLFGHEGGDALDTLGLKPPKPVVEAEAVDVCNDAAVDAVQAPDKSAPPARTEEASVAESADKKDGGLASGPAPSQGALPYG